jgi:hypothetical protein
MKKWLEVAFDEQFASRPPLDAFVRRQVGTKVTQGFFGSDFRQG